MRAGGLWLAGFAFGRSGWSAEQGDAIQILMRSDPAGAQVGFDPIGLLVRPGQRIRWVNHQNNVHTSTAYHPANRQHALRIPADATPWDSGYLVHPGDSFEVRLTIEGVYDYYCAPHESAGMVGRIIVTRQITGDALTVVPETYPDDSGRREWRKMPKAALRNFPSYETILKHGQLPADDQSIPK